MTPAAIYARYSTEEQDPRSIEDQIRRCGDYAKSHALDVIAEFPDAAISGSHTDRPQLRRLLDVATATRRPPFRAVLVDDLSRLSRSIGDTWRVIDDLAAVGVKVIDVRTGMASDDPNARMVFGANSLVNDQFLQIVRYQTHRGLQGRALAGFWTGGTVFGFGTVPEPHPSDPEHPRKVPVIDDAEAKTVRRIFRVFEDGKSYRAIADQLNREEVASPRNLGRGGKHGHGWSHTTIRAILTNEKYIGVWRWNTHKWIPIPRTRKRRRIARPESEHVTREIPELAIIDRAQWQRVQARMAKRKHGEELPAQRNRRTYLLGGMLRCGTCGGPMSICGSKVKAGKRYVSFGCTSHFSRGDTVCTNGLSISEHKITSAFLDALRDVLTGPEVREAFARGFERRVAERTKLDSAADIEKQLEAARRRVVNATKLIVEMPDDLDLRRQREADQKDVRRLEAVLAERSAMKPRALPDPAKVGAAISGFLGEVAAKDPERGRAALVRCVSPLVVTPKTTGPGRVEVAGSVDVSRVVSGSGSSGGRI